MCNREREKKAELQVPKGAGAGFEPISPGEGGAAAQICVKPLRKHNLAGIVCTDCSKTELKTGIYFFFPFFSRFKLSSSGYLWSSHLDSSANCEGKEMRSAVSEQAEPQN